MPLECALPCMVMIANVPNNQRYGPKFIDALAFAGEMFTGRLRRNTSVPYIAHPLSVSALVWESGGDEGQAIAALLGDAVRYRGDLPIAKEISQRFGARVARIVDVCNPPGDAAKISWKDQNKSHLKVIKSTKLNSALLVIAANNVQHASNLVSNLKLEGARAWDLEEQDRADILWHFRKISKVLNNRMDDHILSARLATAVKEMHRLSGK